MIAGSGSARAGARRTLSASQKRCRASQTPGCALVGTIPEWPSAR